MKRIFCFITTFITAFICQGDESPALLHGKRYNDSIIVENYWVSEKLDGVRAYWDGTQLLSRQGNSFYPPVWFIKDFPATQLDGELWIARNTFEKTVSAVRKKHPVDKEWKAVSYYIFELPGAGGSFSERIEKMETLVDDINNPHLRMVKQFRVTNREDLFLKLDEVVKGGGEGLMLHDQGALYHTGRSDALPKLKPYQDAEAIVVAHLPGKGKHKGRMGSIVVEIKDGLHFRLGTGFSDLQRDNPPPVGTRVTYKYYGLTRNGIPKFASFLRSRQADEH